MNLSLYLTQISSSSSTPESEVHVIAKFTQYMVDSHYFFLSVKQTTFYGTDAERISEASK